MSNLFALIRYRIAITPVNDPSTGNFKVRIDGARTLTAHVVKDTDGADDGKDASGVTVYFYTNLSSSSLSNAQGTTNSAGVAGVTLDGGWVPGTATVRAKVFDTNGGEYSDVALIPVVAPDGENTDFIRWDDTNGVWGAYLTPSDVKFTGLQVTERDGGVVGSGDTCWYPNDPAHPTKFQAVTKAGSPTSAADSNNWWTQDSVGWGSSDPAHYRSRTGFTSCGTHFLQYMDVVVPGRLPADYIYYTSNILGAGIQATTVTSERDGLSRQRTWP